MPRDRFAAFTAALTGAARPALLAALVFITAPVAAPAQEADAPVVRPVILMPVEANGDGVTRQFFGQIVARQTVDLAFQVSGQITEFAITEGDRIAEGTRIAALDTELFELQLTQAQLQFDQAERAVERLARLSDTVSQVSRDDAETQLSLAGVALRNAQYSLDHAELFAPFDAIVAERHVANFSSVVTGTPVVRLHDMSEIRVEIDVPEVLFRRARARADMVMYAQFPGSEVRHPLVLKEFIAEASAIGQTFRLTLAMQHPQNLTVLPGSSVTVYATALGEGTAPVIPASAIRIANDGATSVMRFVPGEGTTGRVEAVAVTLEPTRDGRFQVTEGLTAGDEIVRAGAHLLHDGETVRRFAGFSN